MLNKILLSVCPINKVYILNFAMQVGNLQNSYNAVQKSLEVFPGHMDSKELMKQLEQHFAAL